jgi:ERCC4-related helicase
MTLKACDFRLSYGPSDDRLHGFYIPALKASARYDRMTGFFSSSALSVAAEGIAHLIVNDGTMRLLVGAQLSAQDVEAIRQGHDDVQEVLASKMERALPDPEALTDEIARDRLAALAWMVATGTLTMRVVVPKGPDGLPLPASRAEPYFHPKIGILSDRHGNQVVFSGSINESITAWDRNYEHFTVFTSWDSGRVYIAENVGRFERLWSQREPDWFSLPVPEAARRRLLAYTPSYAPERDPLESETSYTEEHRAEMTLASAIEREKVRCQFVRDAPYLVGATGLGIATCALTPWPHQHSVAHQLTEGFPARYLLADEVGLGKTIEAGLVLRQLWLSGVVKRALVLAPKSVLRQWQEELYEKFALNVPVYEGSVFVDLWEESRTPTTQNPWNDVGLALASSQLMKRTDRRDMLLDARPWDLVIVDEAHHARRRDFGNLSQYRPNRMLELLNALQFHTRGLILMTATPMQVHPIEIWDLLNLMGLSGEWGADGRQFLRFYEELRKPKSEVDWRFVFRMVRAELELRDREFEEGFEAKARQSLGIVDWQRIQDLPEERNPGKTLRTLSEPAQHVATRMVKAHTPLRRLTFRNTRALLRRYVEDGLLDENVPRRDPQPAWIPMREKERELYARIEEYISQFYRKYEDEQKGLGFVMTVYRRRLTSSFYAIQRSLEKRLHFLRGRAGLGLDEDDLEQEALSQDVDEIDLTNRAIYKEEIAYVEDFVHDLKSLGGYGSKVAQLIEDLRHFFSLRDTVIVFTHYTDTMDFLREQLRQTYGSKVACYSGRGGERWDGVMWVPETKEEIKNAFRDGEEIKVLLCTEAASEGLNLQTCGVMINYDMPWNPMRVEQRIGRIDRIGQVYDEVWIRNYFYEETVEASVYRALSSRIEWFQDVVGPLQPILARVERAIKSLAMVPAAERDRVIADELERLQSDLDRVDEGFDLSEWAEQAEAHQLRHTPLSLAELSATLTTSPTLKSHFRPHERIDKAFWLHHDGEEIAITFDPKAFDTYPDTLRLMTYGSPLLASLLDEVPTLEKGERLHGEILRLETKKPLPRIAYYVLDEQHRPQNLARLDVLRRALGSDEAPASWTQDTLDAAQEVFESQVQDEWQAIVDAEDRLVEAQTEALKARAARLLLDAALVELALGRQPSLLSDETYPVAFNRQAVTGLRRHGYPWTALLGFAQEHIRLPSQQDPFYHTIRNDSQKRLHGRLGALKQRADRLVNEIGRRTRAM